MQFQPPDFQWMKELWDRFAVRLRGYGLGILDSSEERKVGREDVDVVRRYEKDS